MTTDNLVAKLYQSSQTVFTTSALALIWSETNSDNLKSKIAYYVKQGVLIRLTRGVFAKDKEYNSRELANNIYTPSYISFETALRDAGMIFQHYDTIFIAASWGREMKIGNTSIKSRKLKDDVLYNPTGVVNQGNYSIATPERAFLDMIYLFPKYYFDNLRSLDWERCFDLARIYDNKQLIKRIKKYQKIFNAE
jgi:predicted transcriptional regulator of viral defense system